PAPPLSPRLPYTTLFRSLALNGHPEQRLPNTLNVNFVGQVGVDLLKAVPLVAASVGSACHEGDQQRTFTLSPVLQAMGVPVHLGDRKSTRLNSSHQIHS